MKKLTIISNKTNELSDIEVILKNLPGVEVTIIGMADTASDFSDADALAIIGGHSKIAEILPAPFRVKVEHFISSGKPVFVEYICSISDVYFAEPESTRFNRMLFTGTVDIKGLDAGDIMEEQFNFFLPSYFADKNAKPILVTKKYIKEHDKSEIGQTVIDDARNWAMWLKTDNLIICNFRLCNFIRARFSPVHRWNTLVEFIVTWLIGVKPNINIIPPSYRLIEAIDDETLDSRIEQAVIKSADWFEKSNMLVDNGRLGVKEGLGTEIYPDGTQQVARYVRNDCTGETGLLYAMRYMIDKDKKYLEKSDNLLNYCFNCLQVKEKGIYYGMQRWTESAWGVCYADDCARVLLAQLFKNLFLGKDTNIDECIMSCDFLLNTTGTDGLRVFRTDMISLDAARIAELHGNPANFPSAHYNAYYLGALALLYKMTGHKRFLEVSEKGLSAIMSAYPDTVREQSETEEMCRLILPLALLFGATGKSEHKNYLYRVTEDLQRLRHKTGAYIEWDTGYKAACNMTEGGECSLLTKNGDPIVDLLYSLNWLPQGFIIAYFVTGDEMFYRLWRDISRFMCTAQIASGNPDIAGAWARGYDVDRMEIYGLPNDIGWGPWAIESGWTVGEIGTGLAMGLLKDELMPFFKI